MDGRDELGEVINDSHLVFLNDGSLMWVDDNTNNLSFIELLLVSNSQVPMAHQ